MLMSNSTQQRNRHTDQPARLIRIAQGVSSHQNGTASTHDTPILLSELLAPLSPTERTQLSRVLDRLEHLLPDAYSTKAKN